MDEKGQVSFEYLLTVLFGILLAFAAFTVADYVSLLALDAQIRIDAAGNEAVSALMS